MKQSFHELNICELKKLMHVPDSTPMSDSIFFKLFGYENGLSIFTEPCRLNVYLGLFCIEGEFTIEINLIRIKVTAGSLCIAVPGNICRLIDVDEQAIKKLKVQVLCASQEFLLSINYDFTKLFDNSIRFMDSPSITLSGHELDICKHYFTISQELISSDSSAHTEALRYIISSVFSYLGSLWSKLINESARIPLSKQSIRSKAVFDSFIKLVTEHHDKERNMAFYADKLCLTPKYLSKIIKNVSGRSAPDWIDAFVILEAKNMLKYSDIPIKEIVYKLHFPNQSVFYKFFKVHTGLTPSEYRNGQ